MVPEEIVDLWRNSREDVSADDLRDALHYAYSVSPTQTLRTVCALRMHGERRVFQLFLEWLECYHPRTLAILIQDIPLQYGRWDDLLVVNCGIQKVAHQLANDLWSMENGLGISTVAKWVPSEKSSMDRLHNGAVTRKLRGALQANRRVMRQDILTPLRAKLNCLERLLSLKEPIPSERQFSAHSVRKHHRAVAKQGLSFAKLVHAYTEPDDIIDVMRRAVQGDTVAFGHLQNRPTNTDAVVWIEGSPLARAMAAWLKNEPGSRFNNECDVLVNIDRTNAMQQVYSLLEHVRSTSAANVFVFLPTGYMFDHEHLCALHKYLGKEKTLWFWAIDSDQSAYYLLRDHMYFVQGTGSRARWILGSKHNMRCGMETTRLSDMLTYQHALTNLFAVD
jgi:hypothetical protein